MPDPEKILHATTDATIWAEQFLEVVANGAVVDQALMIGWFANAIETAREYQQPVAKPMTIFEWIDLGVAMGWSSDVVCGTHEGPPLTDEEEHDVQEGWDPCVFVMRVYEPIT